MNKTFLLATRNQHKVGEIRAILGPAFGYLTLDDFQEAPGVIEDAATFAGNASKKASELAKWISVQSISGRNEGSRNLWVLADDSGLEVDALGGAPGVHSARFAALDAGAAGNSADAVNNAKLLRLMAGVLEPMRGARFRCVMALCPIFTVNETGDGPATRTAGVSPVSLFDGVCEGRILERASGAGGFGYDPLFVPAGFSQSFAELGDEIKNQISHRANALRALRNQLL